MSDYRQICLPGCTIPGNIFLAPIAGYSDSAFRSICLDFGANLCFTEMVSAEALARGSCKTRKMLKRAPNEELLCIQLFAANPDSARRAAAALIPLNPALIDLNCGCSIPKILKSGSGAALLKEPERIREIIAAIRQETAIPLSVKLRSGWDSKSINYLRSAQMAIDGGAVMVTLHPRTKSQGFTGKASLKHLSELKKSVTVPVIGSGDLYTAEDALEMIKSTGCDGIMFARGAIGNPFIFRQAAALFKGTAPRMEPLQARQRLETVLLHLQRAVEFKGEKTACREMRKHFCAYTKGLHASAQLRSKAVRAESFSDYQTLIKGYLLEEKSSIKYT